MTTHRLYLRMRQPADYGTELYPEDIGQLLDHQIRMEPLSYFLPGCRSHDMRKEILV